MTCKICGDQIGVDEKTRLQVNFAGYTCSKECARTLKLDERFVEFLNMFRELDQKMFEIMRQNGT